MIHPTCLWCEEPILPGEPFGTYGNGPMAHSACFARPIIGSVAHIEERCACYVAGSTCTDDPGLTRRQAAVAALDAYRLRYRDELPDDDYDDELDSDAT